MKSLEELIRTEHTTEMRKGTYEEQLAQAIREWIKDRLTEKEVKKIIMFIRQNMFLPENENLKQVTEMIYQSLGEE